MKVCEVMMKEFEFTGESQFHLIIFGVNSITGNIFGKMFDMDYLSTRPEGWRKIPSKYLKMDVERYHLYAGEGHVKLNVYVLV